jgi:diguanylate cyclase (GGDEF)-like protein
MAQESYVITQPTAADPRSSLRILVVEDNPADARLTLAALRNQLMGCEMFVVASCRDALAFLERHRDNPVDVVLLDVRLPDGSGLDVLQRLRDDGQLDHTRVVVFSGAHDGEQVVRAHELGASFYLLKPADLASYDTVVHAITRCVTTESPDATPGTGADGFDAQPTILLVEDSPSDARLVTDLLEHGWTAGFAVQHVERLAAARLAIGENVWAIVLDLSLPDANGLTAVEELHAVAPFTPIVVLTGLDDESAGMRALQHGAQDYLQKDGLTNELLGRSVQFAIQRTNALAALTRLATHDSLTDLPNRTLLLDRLQIALARAKRLGTHVAALFIDIDDFKAVNDHYGHQAGDAVLKEAARRMLAALRTSDTVCRLAGDEFAILCEDVPDEQTALIVAERVGRTLAAPYELDSVTIDIKASIGVAMASETLLDAAALLRTADAAMYKAKRATKTHEPHGDA